MKKYLPLAIFVFSFAFPTFSFAQEMMGSNLAQVDSASSEISGDHTEKSETEGKVFREKLQAKEINCEELPDDNFYSIGMYFMGLMTGESHEVMDTMMEKMMGEDGEKQMHIAMGKRMSNCEPDAPMPQGMTEGGMMQMIMGGGMMGGGGNSMMGNFGFMPFGGFGWIFMILFWGLVIVGIVALIKWIMNHGKNETKNKSALKIIKERYARGEINKKEFEEKGKDLR